MVLRDAEGNVVDGLNYGGIVDPWAAEGYQAASGASASGCFVPSPGMGRGFRMGPSHQPASLTGVPDVFLMVPTKTSIVVIFCCRTLSQC